MSPSPAAQLVESTCKAGDLGSIPGLEKGRLPTPVFLGFPGGSAGTESTCNAGDLCSIPGLGRSRGEAPLFTKMGKQNPQLIL